jgi:hypothetical protein
MSALPPKLAAWLVNAFTGPDQSEIVEGDLLEEFSQQASRPPESGIGGRALERWGTRLPPPVTARPGRWQPLSAPGC